MSRNVLLFAAVLCGGLAFVVLSGGTILPPHRHADPTGPSSIAAGPERLRFDGLYRGDSRAGATLFLRFYPQGDVAVLSQFGVTAEHAAGVISRSRPELGQGPYHLQEANVTFTTHAAPGSIDYEGTIGPDGMTLNIRSHVTGYSER